MTRPLLVLPWICVFFLIVPSTSFSQSTKRLAIYPFQTTGLTSEESVRFTNSFEHALSEQQVYTLLLSTEVRKLLTEAGIHDSTLLSPHSLAEAAKIVGADQILQGSISRRGKLYNILIKITEASSATTLYSNTWEGVGEFDQILNGIGAIADDIGKKEKGFARDWKWYTIAAVLVVVGTTIYLIAKNIFKGDRDAAFEKEPGMPDPGPVN